MYVCVCKAVTDTQITHAIRAGACTRKQLYQCFGVGGDCGKCSDHVKELLTLNAPQNILPAANDDRAVLDA